MYKMTLTQFGDKRSRTDVSVIKVKSFFFLIILFQIFTQNMFYMMCGENMYKSIRKAGFSKEKKILNAVIRQ